MPRVWRWGAKGTPAYAVLMTVGRSNRGAGVAVALATALVLGAAGAVLWRLGGPSAGGSVGGPFQLVDTSGQAVTDRSFRGRYMLVYFGYTSCPDICPTTLREMALARQALGPKADRVQPVFVTVDPARDTPTVMRAYVAAIDPSIAALTGPQDAIDAMLRRYHVHRAVQAITHGGGRYLVDHSAVLYLMGPDGRFLAPVRADEPASQMAAEIAARLR